VKYAVYFPQFHEIPENNINFYDKYTDMQNLKFLKVDDKDTPNYQELNIKNLDEYDLLKNDMLIETQLKLLSKYNIDGFAIYYYWFSENSITNKKKIMFDVHEKFLAMKPTNKKIFFIWANENWSDNPAFSNSNHIIKNYYNDIEEHCNELILSFKNDNYLKIENKPVFYIHHTWYISKEKLNEFRKCISSLCVINGFDGIELRYNSMNTSLEELNNNKELYYNFHPNYKKNKSIFKEGTYTKLDYEKYVNKDVLCNSEVDTLFFDFDNRSRLCKPDKLNLSTICVNNTEENCIKYLNKIKRSDTRLLLINAWNEWGEKLHIEPSERKGSYYLNLINKYI
jgi:hypothetical protein